MSTEGQEKTGGNLVSEKDWGKVEIVNAEGQPSVAELEEDNAA